MTREVDRHLERYLGPIERGWQGAGLSQGVQVCLFRGVPDKNAVTYATLGLSDHVLSMPRGRTVRQELLLAVDNQLESENLAKLLAHVAVPIVEKHEAVLRGQVIHLGHPVMAGSACDALYVAMPAYFADGLATLQSSSPPTVIAWLVPLTSAEVAFIETHGWSAFEDVLEESDPALLDLQRPSSV